MDSTKTRVFVNRNWDESALPQLIDYIRIPNKSPAFDPAWQEHGYMDQAVALIERWCLRQDLPGMQLEVVRLPDRTPLIFMDIPGRSDHTVLLYGHLDKQPEMSGWRAGLGPWQPQLEGDRLYGRGGADDGYAVFASLIAVRALVDQGIPHARCVVIIEACEESGSYDLPHYLDALAPRIGRPELVICLDSGCGNYEQLWNTASLRGLVSGDLAVAILTQGVHSGDAGGIVPSSFRILRALLDRIEGASDGMIAAAALRVEIPKLRIEQARHAARVLGDLVYNRFPFVPGAEAVTEDATELILNRTWRPALEITGMAGVPALTDAGNVLRPSTTVRLSLRLPPTSNAKQTARQLKHMLETNPPSHARVSFAPGWCADGWHAPPLAPWLEQALNQASRDFFGAPAMHMGEGVTIPFMGMFGEKYPEAQFLITGVLGPQANAHGPNEFLHLPTAKKLTCCVASVIAEHYKNTARG
jgi:acetylornithine deacetylase/succinyl-diaminopimelate desuccinylase-like protein